MRGPQLTNADVNARLARLAGWKEAAVTHLGKPIGDWVDPSRASHWGVPDYCGSIDLLRRDVLPKLTRDQWTRLDALLEHHWESNASSAPHPFCWFSQYILTAPADVIARAALSALEEEEARDAD